MSDVIRIRVGVNMRAIAGSEQEETVEVPREEWDAMTADERNARLAEEAMDFMANEVDNYAYVIEDEG
jgi:hypothetical protein